MAASSALAVTSISPAMMACMMSRPLGKILCSILIPHEGAIETVVPSPDYELIMWQV